MSSKETILVTGYGGFLGSAVCRWLLDRGYSVRGIARGRYPEMQQAGVEGIVGDVCDASKVEEALAGVSGIIHTAALAGVWGRSSTYEAINVEATKNLLHFARKRGIGAFVHTSSPSVTFAGQPQSGIDESVPIPKHWLCDYPRTKAESERLVLHANQQEGMLSCALRPHLIWGTGDPHLIPRLIQRHKQGRLRRVGDGKNRIDTVHVDAAAEGHGLALEHLLAGDEQVAGRAYFLTDDAPVESWEWIRSILRGAGLTPTTRSISLSTAYRLGWMLETIYRLFRIQNEPPMTRFVALQLGVDHYFSIQSAKDRLGYRPPHDRQARFDAMIPWLQKLGAN